MRQLYNASGQVIASARYDPYGNVVSASGAASAYGFTGEILDATGLIYLRARYYDGPCGYYGDPVKECTCSLSNVLRYQKRISGSLLDRIDIHVEVPRVDYEKLSGDRLGEKSGTIRARVERARERQRKRFDDTNLQVNADMGPAEVRQHCPVDDAGRNLLRAAMQQMPMSARADHRIPKLARTIADLRIATKSKRHISRRRFSTDRGSKSKGTADENERQRIPLPFAVLVAREIRAILQIVLTAPPQPDGIKRMANHNPSPKEEDALPL